MEEDNSQRKRDDWLWLLVPLALLVIIACLALTVGGGAGAAGRVWLESAWTNYPFCPPSTPCPVSVVLNKNHFVIWVVWESHTQQGVETQFRKLLDIPEP